MVNHPEPRRHAVDDAPKQLDRHLSHGHVGQTAKSGLKVFLAALIFKSASDQFSSEDTTGAGTRPAVKFGHELTVQDNPYAHQFSPLHRRANYSRTQPEGDAYG